jgi:dUTP pyrophosphatase
MDLFSLEEVRVKPGEVVRIRSGVAMEIPEGYVGLCWDKSGLSMKHGIKVLAGVIDSSFRGELVMAVINLGKDTYTFEKGHKDIADEIVVVDGTSQDGTVAVAKSFGAKVVVRENFPIFHINKQHAIDLAKSDWVLQLDADEEVGEGIMILPKDTKLGVDLSKIIGEDIIFDVSLPANRPDLFSHYGIAREVSAVTGGKLKEVKLPKLSNFGKEKVAITIASKNDCQKYIAAKLTNIQVSPLSHPSHISKPGCFTFSPTPSSFPRSSNLFDVNAKYFLATFSVSILW